MITAVVMFLSAGIGAWANEVKRCAHRAYIRIFSDALSIAFTGIAIGAGIQLLFRG